jgi:Ca-activated chloride channel family protein
MGEARGTVTLSGVSGAGPWSQTFDVGQVKDRSHGALRQLWARQRIQLLSDYDQFGQDADRKAEVTRLGLAYNLLTAYTSFVAVDTQVRNVGGHNTTVTQPLPMPEGVSDAAVGGGYSRASYPASAPPPMLMKSSAASYAMAEGAAQDRIARRAKAKTAPGHSSPSFDRSVSPASPGTAAGTTGAYGLRIHAFSGITGTSDPAALKLEIEARLMDPALVVALASLPPGTTVEMTVDGAGRIRTVTFSQPFPGAAQARALMTAWRLNSWTGGIAGSMAFTLG